MPVQSTAVMISEDVHSVNSDNSLIRWQQPH